jgi:hypothetical protein
MGGHPGAITDPSFAGRLGQTVGGFGNINSPGSGPGIQPMPMGSGVPIPNINSPGSGPGFRGDGRRHGGRRFDKGFSGFGGFYSAPIIYYGVPYYVPVYPQAVPAPAPVEQPRGFDIREYQGVTPGVEPQRPQPSESVTRYVTLLAFKDSTVLADEDYWLQGDMLVYSTSLGVRAVVPLDRLDLALTQQLNFERNVPFVLEARP